MREDFQTNGDRETGFSLAEEVYLLGLKEREGYISLWNDCISSGLRGCILADLGLLNRVELEKATSGRKGLLARNLIVKSDASTEDSLLDEALKHIKETESPETVRNWIQNFCGDSWNPLKYRYSLRKVRERVAKNLVEKGVLTSVKKGFFLFDMTVHPVVDASIKRSLEKKVQDALLGGFRKETWRMDQRVLALILLSHISDVMEESLRSLKDSDYDVAMERVKFLSQLNFEAEARRSGANEVVWAVVASYI